MPAFAQKDINAWKEEQNLEQQFSVFKNNLDYWDGKYILYERQLNEFYSALKDSVAALEKERANKANRINELENELAAISNQLEDTQAELNASIENQNAIPVLGMNVEKSTYTLVMSSIIVGLLVLSGIVFLLFKRSNKVTVKTKKEFEELNQEFETHKKKALERYTKINTELHNTRMELNKR
jgi:predicted PurR-regulated permease PerM